jgi:hypothetical protein
MRAAMDLRDPSMSLSSLSVLRSLAWMANEQGEVRRSIGRIAEMAGVKERACQNAIKELRERGFLTIFAFEKGGRSHAPIYRVWITETVERVQNMHPLGKGASGAPFSEERVQNMHPLGPERVQQTTIKGAKYAPQLSRDKELGIKRERDTPYSPPFESFWDRWPTGGRKVNKAGAYAIWRAKNLDEREDAVMMGLERWIGSADWAKDGGAYIPLVTTWLNQERYDAQPARVGTVPNGYRPVTYNEQKLKNTIQASEDFRRLVEKDEEAKRGNGRLRPGNEPPRHGLRDGQQRGEEVHLLAAPKHDQ